MSARFVHLHLHSEYSLTDSTIRIPDLVARCAALGQPAVAVTDRNNLFALVKFYKAAEAAGVKPIAGADVTIAESDGKPWQLTLLCRDRAGYLELSRLLSRAWMEGHRHDGVVLRPQWLREGVGGLFAIAGRHSLAGQLAAGGRHDQGEAELRAWQSVFGDRLHLELTRCGLPGEDAFNAFALNAAAGCGIPVLASNEVRFLEPDGFEAHEARACIASGRVLDDPRRPRDYSRDQHLKSSEEMTALFEDAPDALDNTVELARRCNFELHLGTYHLPAFPVPSEYTLESWIRSEAQDGLIRRLEKYPSQQQALADGYTRQDYEQRLARELDVIVRMGFAGYFLIVADFINWAKEHGIPVGPGRGSGAGSLVAWALGITDLDPLPYDLLFERFLNPERVSMPDFDIDFCMDRRDEVIDYVAGKYGRDRVSQIITYGTMAAKAVVRDAGRVLGFPYGFVDSIAKLVPMTLGIGLNDALGRTEKSRKDDAWRSDELIARYNDENDVRDLIDLALQLEDLTRNAGKHAGGVVISPAPLSQFCPLYAEHDGHGSGRNPVTQFDKDDIETVGLVKFDFLGLRTLTIIDWAVKAINRERRGVGNRVQEAGKVGTRRNQDQNQDLAFNLAVDLPRPRIPAPDSPLPAPCSLDITTIPLNDPAVYELFARGQTIAVFQFESRGMRELLKRARPDRFEDLIALNSLFRPGPMDLIPEFVERKHGRAEVKYPHPLLEPVLAPTYGIAVYQEQVMQTAQILAGYSLGGADLLRRAMGKKNRVEMAKERAKFEAGARELHGLEPRVSGPIFDLLEKFAGYGFNKSHAAAYSLVAYQTAWLKVHYPAQFMAAVLSSDMDNTDKVAMFLEEARALGLTILAPDVNASGYMFEAIDDPTPVAPIAQVDQTTAPGRHQGVVKKPLMNSEVPRARDGALVDSVRHAQARKCSIQREQGRALPGLATSEHMQDALVQTCLKSNVIRYGLGAIKGVGRGACEAIVAERVRGGRYTDLFDFCRRVDSNRLNKRVLEALINAGALDRLGPNRPSLHAQLPEVLKAAEQIAHERDAGQESLFGVFDAGPDMDTATPRIALAQLPDWPLSQKLQAERDTLGHYLSGHPIDPYREELRQLVGHDLAGLDSLWENRPTEARSGWKPELNIVVAGQVVSLRKRGESQAFVQLEDGAGQIECGFFAAAYLEYAQLLTRDRILVIEGGLREDDFNGGFALRARRCWEYQRLCETGARRLAMGLDLRVPGALAGIERILAQHRPGSTPLLYQLVVVGAQGQMDLTGAEGVRVEPDLPALLRAQPGVRAVKLSLAKPWAH